MSIFILFLQILLTSSSDGIEASELKRPLTPPPENNAPKRGRPRKAPSRFVLDNDCADYFDESEAWGLTPQTDLFTPHYLDPSTSTSSSTATTTATPSTSTAIPSNSMYGGMDDFVSNKVNKNLQSI